MMNLQLYLRVKAMRIGEIARRAGIATSRIRFYESKGLLTGAPRRPNGYRDYPASVVEVLSFIDRAQALGFSLREIGTALPAAVDGKLAPTRVLEALERKRAEVDAHIAASKALRRRLLKLIDEQRECVSDG
jgi:MerR family transcriptional regulator, copper efflux regulator